MAFASAGLSCVSASKAGNAPSLYTYQTTDALSVVRATGYFDNGSTTNTGMRNILRVNDIIMVVSSTGGTPVVSLNYVNSNSSGIIDITDGTTVSATDTD